MRLISLKKYNENTMQLAAPIFDSKRRILLGAGQVIHPVYKERLINLGINMIIVEDEVSKGITLDDMLEMPTWMDAIGEVQTFFEKVKANQPPDILRIQKLAFSLVAEMKRRKAILLIPSHSLTSDTRLYGHSVNVTLLALQAAKRLNYNDFKLQELAVGCLLHDVGKMKTDDEKEHPEVGFEVIRKLRELSLLSAHVAYQHHEMLDGTGYPRRILGDKFLEYPQICGVANMYEKLINGGEPPHTAMEMIMAQHGIKYAKEITDAFIRSVPSYPPGTKVELDTGEAAIVVRIDSYIHRPVVRILETNKEISLWDHPTMMIKKVVD